MADMTDYDRIMRQKREATSARFGTLPPELQPSPDAEDPLEGAGFGELTPEQKKQLEEEKKAKSALYGQRPIDKMIEGADRLSLVDPTPTMDTISTGLQLGRGVMDDASSSELGQIASIGLAGAMVPFISAKSIKAMKSVPADHPLRVEGRQVVNDVQRRVDAGELTDAQGIKEMNEKLEVLAQNIGVERTLEKGEKDLLAKIKRSKRSDAKLKKAGTKERERSDQQRAEATGKAQRLTSEIDRDLQGKASVGEFAGGKGTYVAGGRARELDEDKRLRGSRKDPAQEYGSGPTATGPRKVIRRGQTQFVRPGAQMELEQLKKAHRAKPRRERGPEPTEADVPNFYMTKQQYEEFTTQSTNKRAANLERRRRQRTQRRIAESAAQKEAAQQAAKPTQYNQIEMDYLRSLPAESYDAARKQLDAAKAGGMVVTRNKKGEFGFKSASDDRDISDRRRTGRTRRGQPQAPVKDLPRLKKKPTADDELKAQTVSRLDKLIADADTAGLAGGESNVIVERLRNTKARLERGSLSPSDVAKRLDKLEKRAPKKQAAKPKPQSQEEFEREVRAEQAAARGGFVGDEADYFKQVDAMKQQARRDRQLLEEKSRQGRRKKEPEMGDLSTELSARFGVKLSPATTPLMSKIDKMIDRADKLRDPKAGKRDKIRIMPMRLLSLRHAVESGDFSSRNVSEALRKFEEVLVAAEKGGK